MLAIPFGVDEKGVEVTFPVLEANFLLGGIPGGGKSGGLNALLAGVMRLENTAIIFIDPKKVEFAFLKDRGSAFVTSLPDGIEVLSRVMTEVDKRTDELVSRGIKKFTPAEFSKEFPLIVIAIDELANLTSGGVTKDEVVENNNFATLLRRVISLGRAVGICVITATQKPEDKVVPSGLRDLISFRIAFKTTNYNMTDVILGTGASSNGGKSQDIPVSQKGMCYLLSETSTIPIRAKAYLITDDMLKDVVAHTLDKKIVLDWLSDFDAATKVVPQISIINFRRFDEMGLELTY
jgi:S-DNA-T family DNA segregation ATPase FtsK/SpoIIIE